MAFVIL